jgi:iron(III) transport system substrate-binding protein
MRKAFIVLASMLLAPGALAQSADWQKTWDKTLAAAKAEGKVVVAGSPDPVMRKEIIPAFEKRFGIPIDFIAGHSSAITGRARTERASGIYSIDVYLAGPDTAYNALYKGKMIDPILPQLILPEVTDASKWKGGKPWFVDDDHKYVMRLFNSIDSWLFINTDKVKLNEVKSAQDLLNPKWKGKMASEDPTSTKGAGGNFAALMYAQLGPDFAKKLYVDQKVVVSGDRRQLSDWLARGTEPICLTCRADDVSGLQKEGFKIAEVFHLDGLKDRLSASPFEMELANKAPHPNAARVFVNWMAGKEAVTIYSRAAQAASMRTDVDESFLDPRVIPKAGASYFDDGDPKWRSGEKQKINKKMKTMLRGY